ncbi:MAG: type II toxin-antitoxin system HicB family antitoxin [Cohaesibacter sp.]|nr:type II toxin-antitoxin system HicB family antitoxin [Cohaesibacter sp.]
MKYYYALIEGDSNNYGVRFPQFETIFSADDSVEEARKNAAEALQFFFGGAPCLCMSHCLFYQW